MNNLTENTFDLGQKLAAYVLSDTPAPENTFGLVKSKLNALAQERGTQVSYSNTTYSAANPLERWVCRLVFDEKTYEARGPSKQAAQGLAAAKILEDRFYVSLAPCTPKCEVCALRKDLKNHAVCAGCRKVFISAARKKKRAEKAPEIELTTYKSLLNMRLQKLNKHVHYVTKFIDDESGFHSVIIWEDKEYVGTGRNQKIAEATAAKTLYLEQLQHVPCEQKKKARLSSKNPVATKNSKAPPVAKKHECDTIDNWRSPRQDNWELVQNKKYGKPVLVFFDLDAYPRLARSDHTAKVIGIKKQKLEPELFNIARKKMTIRVSPEGMAQAIESSLYLLKKKGDLPATGNIWIVTEKSLSISRISEIFPSFRFFTFTDTVFSRFTR